MMRARTFTLSALVAFSLSVPALAAECTVEDRSTLEDVLGQAPSCVAAYKMFEDCALGGSGDVSLGQAVQEKCEGGFLSKLDAGKKRAYNKQIDACDRKYAKQQGTMYRSAAAFCRAGTARDYAKKYAK
jgi:hypothetical protein